MAAALGNAKPRGRGRGGGMPGNIPRGIKPMPLGPGAAGNGNGGTSARVNPPGRGMMNPPGQDRPSQGPTRGRGRGAGGGQGQGIGVGGAALPGPGGRQLAARVSSGAITGEQAQRTMDQRQTLEKAFGPDWRKQITAGGKSFAQVRQGLAKNPGNAKLAALNKKLLEGRKAALEAARKKNAGGGNEGQE